MTKASKIIGTIVTPEEVLPCGASIITQHLEGSFLVDVLLTNLTPGSIQILSPSTVSPSKVKIRIALINLPVLAKLLQKYLPKKSRKRKKVA